MPDHFRRALRWLRHTPDRLLHRRRHSQACRALRATPPRLVLFVCNGNICRSPFAEVAARRARAGSVQGPVFASAGLMGPDRPSPEEAVAAAGERGVDLAPHRSRLVTPALVAQADLVLVMDAVQGRKLRAMFRLPTRRLALLGDFDPEPISTRAILDPVEQPIDVFRTCYARIERCVDALAAALGSPAAR